MKTRNKVFLFSTAILGVLGVGTAVASTQIGYPRPLHKIQYFKQVIPAKQSKRQIRREYDTGRRAMNDVDTSNVIDSGGGKVESPRLINYGDTSRFAGSHYGDMPQGNINEGSPRHHTISGIIHNGYDYDIALGHYHSHLEYTNLSEGHRVIRIVNPKTDHHIIIDYPKSTLVAVKQGKKTSYVRADTELIVTPVIKYEPWHGNRSLVFSKNIANGYMENGFTRLDTHIRFFNPKTHKPITANKSWIYFRDINGLGKYGIDLRGGQDAWRNDAHWVHTGSTLDHTGEYIENQRNDGQKQYRYAGRRALADGKFGIKTFNSYFLGRDVDGGAYNTPYNDNDNNDVSHDMFFHLVGDSANFVNGTSVGYQSFQPLLNTGVTKRNPKKPTLYNCHLNKAGKPVTNLAVGIKASRYQLSDGNKFKISKDQYHNIVNGDHKVTKHGLKYWEDNIMPCAVTTPHKYIPAHPKINPFHPTTPVKYVTGVHTMNTINADGMTFHNQGGALSHPNQTFTYHIVGKLPKRTINNTPYYKYYNHYDKYGNITKTDQYIDHYYDGHTDDYYNITDHLPKYVNVKKAKVDVDGASVKHKDHYVKVHFDHDVWDDNNGGTYHITVKVTANNLPELSPSTNRHWTKMLNGSDIHDGGGYNTSTYASGQEDGNQTSKKYSNAVPVEIKIIKANIWHYDYNHNHQVKNNWFPDAEQPMGITNDIYNPDSKYFKNYRFHDNLTNSDKAKGRAGGVLSHHTDSWYVGSHHFENTINSNKRKYQSLDGHQYRFAYPSLNRKNPNEYLSPYNLDDTLSQSDDGYPVDDYMDIDDNGSIQQDFDKEESWLFNSDSKHTTPADVRANGRQYMYMNANPDQGNYYKGGFTQNDYMPYYVPRVSLNQKINRKTGKAEPSKSAYRMVIDTDKTDHGLPFRLDMKAQNLLYGINYNDFNGVYVKMDITANNGNDKLYSNIRPLAGNSQDALIHQGTYHKHTHTLSESPKGTNDYHGYIEANALKQAESNNYDLNTAPYNYAKGTRLPINVHFSLVKANGKPLKQAKQPDVDMTDINTHAYIARDPKVTNNDFGLQQITGDDAPKNPTAINKKQASFVDPERTVEYGDGHVRELKEQLTVTQPRQAIGKAGYGISANDLGVDYRGHLETPRYAHKGTNMQVGFPVSFNSKDSNLSYSHDKRNPSLLGTNLLHVSPSISENINNGASDDNDSASTLDTDDDNDSEDEVDDDFDDAFPEDLHPGEFSTTYGFYPKASVHNQGDNNNDNGNIQLSSDNAGGIFAPHAKYGDALANDSSISKFGLTTNSYNTSNNTKAITADGQNERLYTPIFLNTGKYKMTYHRAFGSTSRKHRLGGNFYDINEKRPIKMTGDMYLTKDASKSEQNNDELSLQPILTNPENGLMQTPLSNPAYPDLNDYHTPETVNGHTVNMPTGWLTNNLWTGMFGSSNDYNDIE